MTLTVGDLLPAVVFTITDAAGNPVDLTAATVVFRMVDFYSKAVVVNDSAAAILQTASNAPNKGQVVYYWNEGDTAIASMYQAWFIVTFGTATMRVPANDTFFVRITPGY